MFLGKPGCKIRSLWDKSPEIRERAAWHLQDPKPCFLLVFRASVGNSPFDPPAFPQASNELAAVDFPAVTATLKSAVPHRGGVTASTEVIAVRRHTGVHASVIVCKNTIANQNLAYAA